MSNLMKMPPPVTTPVRRGSSFDRFSDPDTPRSQCSTPSFSPSASWSTSEKVVAGSALHDTLFEDLVAGLAVGPRLMPVASAGRCRDSRSSCFGRRAIHTAITLLLGLVLIATAFGLTCRVCAQKKSLPAAPAVAERGADVVPLNSTSQCPLEREACPPQIHPPPFRWHRGCMMTSFAAPLPSRSEGIRRSFIRLLNHRFEPCRSLVWLVCPGAP